MLGWTLKFFASGLLDKDTAMALVELMLRKGAMARLPSFPEKVLLLEPSVCVCVCVCV